jgi:hypothetical protein
MFVHVKMSSLLIAYLVDLIINLFLGKIFYFKAYNTKYV